MILVLASTTNESFNWLSPQKSSQKSFPKVLLLRWNAVPEELKQFHTHICISFIDSQLMDDSKI